MSASCFLVSTSLIWICGPKLIRSNNQSSATPWVRDTCLIVGLLPLCKSGKRRKTGASALCPMDDANCFHMIRLELKTSVNDMNVTVVSTVTGCDVTTVQQHYKGSTSTLRIILIAGSLSPKKYEAKHGSEKVVRV